jgi:hypothetical protein
MKRKSGRKAALFLGRARWLNAPLFAWIVGLERSPTFQPFSAGRFRSSTIPALQKHPGWNAEIRNSRPQRDRLQRTEWVGL